MWETRILLITLRKEDMRMLERNRESYYTATYAKEVFDVSSAGDRRIALFSLAISGGALNPYAAQTANQASSGILGKLDMVTLKPTELGANFCEGLKARAA